MAELPAAVRAALVEAQAQSGDPLAAFVYDLDALRRHVAALMAELPPGVELYYAIKANSEAPILAALAPLVHGFEISSPPARSASRSSSPVRASWIPTCAPP